MTIMLGRPLTANEQTNFQTYLDIAIERVSELLCFTITDDNSPADEPMTFNARGGYSTVFTPPFTSISEVKLNDVVVTNYTSYQWDSRNASWYNSIVFDSLLEKGDEIEITAVWEFGSIPLDLQALIAKYFNLASAGAKVDTGVRSKKVEDFSISYDDKSAEERLIDSNLSTINKYSLCAIGNVQHGQVC